MTETGSDWLITLDGDCTSSDLMRGIEALNHELKGGPEREIASLLMGLVATTSRPPSMDDVIAAAYMKTMPAVMWDYPIDVVRSACAAWRRVPSHGKWWPTEQDLRIQCEKFFDSRRRLRAQAMRILNELQRKEQSEARMKGPSFFAGNKGQAFKAEMRKLMTPQRFDAYFHASQIMFQGGTILVRTKAGENALSSVGAELLDDLDLAVRYAPQAFIGIRQPTWEDDTPEERAEVARKFHRLGEAMARGENLAALRESGEI